MAVDSGRFWQSDQEIKTKEALLSTINALRSTWRPLDQEIQPFSVLKKQTSHSN